MENIVTRQGNSGDSPLEQLKHSSTAARVKTTTKKIAPAPPQAAPAPVPLGPPTDPLPANNLLVDDPAPPTKIDTPDIKVGGGVYLGLNGLPEFPTSNRNDAPQELPFLGGQTMQENLTRIVGPDTQDALAGTQRFLDEQTRAIDAVTQQSIMPNLYTAPELQDSFSRDHAARANIWQAAAQADAQAARIERDFAVSQAIAEKGSTKNAFQHVADMVGFRPGKSDAGSYLEPFSKDSKGNLQFNGINTVLYTLGLLQNSVIGGALDVRNLGQQIVNTVIPPWLRQASASTLVRTPYVGRQIAGMIAPSANTTNNGSNFVEALRGRQFSFSDKKGDSVGMANDWGFRVGAPTGKGWGFDVNPSVLGGVALDVVVGFRVDKLVRRGAKNAQLLSASKSTPTPPTAPSRDAQRANLLNTGLEAFAIERPTQRALPPASFRSDPARKLPALPPARNANPLDLSRGVGAYNVELPGGTVMQRRTALAMREPALLEALPPRRATPVQVKPASVPLAQPAPGRTMARGFQRNNSKAAISRGGVASSGKPRTSSAMFDDIATAQAALNNQNPAIVKAAINNAIANKSPSTLLAMLDVELPKVGGNTTANMFDVSQRLRILHIKKAQLQSDMLDAKAVLDNTPELGRRLVQPVARDPERITNAPLIADMKVVRSNSKVTHGTRVENLQLNQVDPIAGAARSELGSGVYFYSGSSKVMAESSALATAAENLPPLEGRVLGSPTVHSLQLSQSLKLIDANAPSNDLAAVVNQLAPEVGAKPGDSLVEVFDKAAANLDEADALALQQEVTQVLVKSGYDGAKAGDIVSVYNTSKLPQADVKPVLDTGVVTDAVNARAAVEEVGAAQTKSLATRGAADEAKTQAIAQQLDDVEQLIEKQSVKMQEAVSDSGLLDDVDEFAEAQRLKDEAKITDKQRAVRTPQPADTTKEIPVSLPDASTTTAGTAKKISTTAKPFNTVKNADGDEVGIPLGWDGSRPTEIIEQGVKLSDAIESVKRRDKWPNGNVVGMVDGKVVAFKNSADAAAYTKGVNTFNAGNIFALEDALKLPPTAKSQLPVPADVKQLTNSIVARHQPTEGVIEELLSGVKVPSGDRRLVDLVRKIITSDPEISAKTADDVIEAMGERTFNRIADKLDLDTPLPALKAVADEAVNGKPAYDRLTQLLKEEARLGDNTPPEISAEIRKLMGAFDDEALDKEWDELLKDSTPTGGSTGNKISPCE
jgi:hypothetical protein